MDMARVDALVDGFAQAFEAGLDFYSQWKKRVESENHYQRKENAASIATTKDALSTSLDMSNHRIRATYQVGFALIGPDYSAGDDECRQCLGAHLAQLKERIEGLRQAIDSKQRRFISLNDIFVVSEAARIKCVTALADQYRRLAAGRAVPQEMPIPRPGRRSISMPRQESPAPPFPPVRVLPARDDFDRQTAVWSTNSDPPVFQSEPPSPPLTPKVAPDDVESCYGGPSEAATRRQTLRPKNSVFSIFCPEAMALQVDPNRAIPTSSKKCGCGFKWRVPELPEAMEYMTVKDGFRMTRRFLAKSHCDKSTDEGVAIGPSADQPSPGYGCVLCTSTGRTETYETAENLQAHINAAHNKWQMIHDKDMTR
ncbi:hypothetical protein B0H63DRAFT_449449 [Podospora didyma]|uniref:Uncharacterized protein n=1 Tax=Podospora didyma TaxID=330526 RepID=A0AAE0NPM7_9PEZI|nr:hypothetical protein B0H63DRAFT_449449 [Podospora didyma]